MASAQNILATNSTFKYRFIPLYESIDFYTHVF